MWKENHYYATKEVMQSYNDGHRELPRNMNVSWFGRWLGAYFEFKGWKREDSTNGGIRKFSVSGFESKEDVNDNIDF
jgi:hypothetical protein